MEFKFEGVTIDYDNKIILKDLNFEIKKGDFVSILGRNGSGKSTIIKALSQQVSLKDGKVLYLNKEINKYKKKTLAQKISFLLQFNFLSEDITVKDYVIYGRVPFKGIFESVNKEDEKIVNRALRDTKLENYAKRKLSSLSGGERQRVYLAMCLAQEPDVIILDEPTNHLDLKFQFELLSLVKDINQKENVTIICVLHDLNQAIKFSNKYILLKDNKIYKKGNLKEVINKQNIKEVFDIDVKIHKNEKNTYIEYII